MLSESDTASIVLDSGQDKIPKFDCTTSSFPARAVFSRPIEGTSIALWLAAAAGDWEPARNVSLC